MVNAKNLHQLGGECAPEGGVWKQEFVDGPTIQTLIYVSKVLQVDQNSRWLGATRNDVDRVSLRRVRNLVQVNLEIAVVNSSWSLAQ